MPKNYLSEFEQEFEMEDTETSDSNTSSSEFNDNESDSEYSYELNDEVDDELESEDEFEGDEELENDELELNDELENNDEFENDEFESNDEYESDTEIGDGELENDYASWSREGNYDRDREFETRIYRAIRSNTDSELQTELELDNVLHEMEQDYFFGRAKSLLRKAKKLGKFAIPGYAALKGISSLGRLNIRNLLKNKLLQTAAGFIPGAGPIVSKAMGIAGSMMNNADAAKQKIQDIVNVGKDAYQDLATAVPDAQSEMEVREASKMALKKAIHNHKARVHRRQNSPRNFSGRGMNVRQNRTKRVFPLPPNARVAVFPNKISINKRQQVIPIKANTIVVVKNGKLIVWEPK